MDWLQDRLGCEAAENGGRIHLPRAIVEDTFFTRSSVRGVVRLDWERVLADVGIPRRRRKELCRLIGRWVIDALHDRVWAPRCEIVVVRGLTPSIKRKMAAGETGAGKASARRGRRHYGKQRYGC